MSLKCEIYNKAVAGGITNDNTRKVARSSAAKFATWAAKNGYKGKHLFCNQDVATKALQEYANDMVAQGYSPATVHTRLAAPCKAFSINMAKIDKPIRSGEDITRSRGGGNQRGHAQVAAPAFARLVSLQSSLGLRRSELGKLYGRDLVHDESGNLCVQVKRGKGGKHQLQRVLPKDVPTVKAIMGEHGADALVFDSHELANKIDLHGMRAAHARIAYDYYATKLLTEPTYYDQLKAELVARWDAERPDASPRQRNAYISKLNNSNPIYLRESGNYSLAVENDRPTVYNRLAVMAVSVFHLSHWRTDVTISHYLV